MPEEAAETKMSLHDIPVLQGTIGRTIKIDKSRIGATDGVDTRGKL